LSSLDSLFIILSHVNQPLFIMKGKNNNKTAKNQNNSEEVKQQTIIEKTQPINQEQIYIE